MLRAAVRMLSVLFGSALALLVTFGLQEQTQMFPLGTDTMVVLDTSTTSLPKKEIVAQLDDVARGSGGILVKPTASLEDSREYTFYVFGECNTPRSKQSVWSFSRKGIVRCAHELGDYPVAGAYAYVSNSALGHDFQQWAQDAGVSVVYSEHANLRKAVISSLENNGMGILLTSTFFALGAVALVWIAARADSRRIRYTAGLSPSAIHGHDTIILSSAALPPVLLGAGVTTLIILTLTDSWPVALKMLVPVGISCLVAVGLMAAVFYALSALAGVGKSLQSLRSARAYASIRHLGTALRFISIMLVAFALPYTVSYSTLAWHKAKAGDAWRNVESSVVMSFVGNPDGWNESVSLVGEYVNLADREGLAYLSTVVNLHQFLQQPINGYSKLVIANKAFLDASVPGWENERVEPLDGKTQHDFLEAFGPQLEIWLKDGSAKDVGGNYYRTVSNRGIPAASLAVGEDQQGEVSQALVLALDSLSTLKPDFVAAGTASHWVFFADKERSLDLLNRVGFNAAVSSTDYVAAEITSQSEAFRRQALQGAVGAALAILGAIVISFQGAYSWAQAERRRIFALRSHGISPIRIAWYPITVDLLVLLAGLIGAYAVGITIYGLEPIFAGLLGAVLGIVYFGQTFVAYQRAVDASFERSAARNY